MKIKKLLLLLSFTMTLVSCGNTNPSTPISSSTSSSSLDSTSTSNTDIISSSESTTDSSTSSSSSEEDGSYYGGFDFELTDDAMKLQVKNLMLNTHKTYNTYDALKTILPKMNEDPTQPGYMHIFYSDQLYEYGSIPMSFSGSVNREHVWPNSRGVGKNGPGADPYIIEPAYAAMNSSRGNSVYSDENDGGFTPEMDEYKGDAARICFYAAAHYYETTIGGTYYNLVLNDNTDNSGNNMGKLTTLLKWNLENPVNDWELYRNDKGQELIGNRNPFVDYPQLACQIWGNTSEETKQVCSSSPSSDPESITATNMTLEVGRKSKVSYTIAPYNLSTIKVDYRNYDDSIVSFDSDNYAQGLKAGSTQVTVFLSDFPNVSTTFTVTVTEEQVLPDETPLGQGEITLDISTMNLSQSTTNVTKDFTVKGIDFSGKNIRNISQADRALFIATDGYIYNTTTIGNISSITINYMPFDYGSSISATAAINLTISDVVLSKKPGLFNLSEVGADPGKEPVTYTVEQSGIGYFRIDVPKNIHLSSIVIAYNN